MKARTFTLSFDPVANRFDDTELLAFLAETEALSIIDHFFVREGEPLWAILVTFRPSKKPGEPPPQRSQTDPSAELDPAERIAYEAIRAWRNQKARGMGRPAYVLLTNEQAADVARKRPSTTAELISIPGIGDTKAADFGAELLSLISGLAPREKSNEPINDSGASHE